MKIIERRFIYLAKWVPEKTFCSGLLQVQKVFSNILKMPEYDPRKTIRGKWLILQIACSPSSKPTEDRFGLGPNH